MKQEIKEWTNVNYPVGKQLGYPDCCIKAFCDQPPSYMNKSIPNHEDIVRYKASKIKGIFTGFIPCYFHAKQIVNKKITLSSLIKERDNNLPTFPNAYL